MWILPLSCLKRYRWRLQLGQRIWRSAWTLERSRNCIVSSIHYSLLQVWHFVQRRNQNAQEKSHRLHRMWSLSFNGYRHKWLAVLLGRSEVRANRQWQKNKRASSSRSHSVLSKVKRRITSQSAENRRWPRTYDLSHNFRRALLLGIEYQGSTRFEWLARRHQKHQQSKLICQGCVLPTIT